MNVSNNKPLAEIRLTNAEKKGSDLRKGLKGIFDKFKRNEQSTRSRSSGVSPGTGRRYIAD